MRANLISDLRRAYEDYSPTNADGDLYGYAAVEIDQLRSNMRAILDHCQAAERGDAALIAIREIAKSSIDAPTGRD